MFTKEFIRKISQILLLATFYFLITSLLTYPLITQFTTHMVGGGEDGPVHVWHLWWLKKAILELGQSPLITDYIFYPQKINLVFDVHTFTNAIIALPLSYFFNWPTVSNILVFLGFILSGIGSFYLIKKIWNFDLGALFGSLVFTFSPVVLAQMTDGHFNLTTTWFLPFFLIFFLKVTDPTSSRRFSKTAGLRGASFRRFKSRFSPIRSQENFWKEIATWHNAWKFFKDPILAGFFLGIFALNDYTLSAFALSLSGLIVLYRLLALSSWSEALSDPAVSSETAGESKGEAIGSPQVRIIPKRKLRILTLYFFRIFLVYCVYAIIFSPLLIPALKNYLTGFKPGVSLMTQNVWSADLLAFIMPQIWHPFWNFLVRHLKVSAVESTVFLGYIVVVFVGFVLFKWFECLWKFCSLQKHKNTKTQKQLFSQEHENTKTQERAINNQQSTISNLPITDCQLQFGRLTFWLFLAASFFILSLGPFLHYNSQWQWRIFGYDIVIPLPFALYHKVPIIGGTQEPARMVIFLMLPLGVLCAYALKVLINNWKKIYQIIFVTICIIILLFEYCFYPYPTFDLTVPKIYYQIGQDTRDVTVMVMPLGWNSGNRSIGKNVLGNLQYYQVVHNKKSFRGTVARLPGENFDFYEKIDGMQFLIEGGGCPRDITDLHPERIHKILRDFNVGYIVMHLNYGDEDKGGIDVGCMERVILEGYEKIYDDADEQIVAYKKR